MWNKYMFILMPSQKRWGIVLMFMTFIGALLETLGISIILPLVQVMLDPYVLRENEYASSIINTLGLDTDGALIWAVGIAVVGVYLIKNGYLLLLSYMRAKYSCKIQRELSCEMMNSYMKRGYLFFLDNSSGELLRGMVNSIQSTYEGIYHFLRILAELLTVACICIYVMMSDLTMAVCVIALVVFCLVTVAFGFRNWSVKNGKIQYYYLGEINKLLLQAFQGIKEVLVMKREQYYLDTYRNTYIKQQKGVIGKTVGSESPTYIIEAICVTGLIITVCIKAVTPGDKTNMVPQLAAFAVAAFRILPSLGRISSYFNMFMMCIPSINDTYSNFEIARKQNYDSLVRKDIIQKEDFSALLSVDHLTFSYPNTEKTVLDDISLDIKKGQAVAFVGASGAGKTTLSDIILGLLNPQSGTVKIDGVDIHNIPAGWGKIVGFVPQNVYLIDDTIKKNIAFGIVEKEIDEEKVWYALQQAQMTETVNNLPDKLNTKIGEHGTRLSGGQRQRIAIARALYNNPEILVMDEATSALDSDTETAVMEAIEALHGDKTLIIIAHRLTTIRNCDAIYEIGNGRTALKRYEELH